MSRVRTQGAELAVGVRRGSRTAPGRAKGLEENGAGPSGGGGGERGIFKHRGQGQARWAFRAWGSGGDGIYCAHTQPAVRERGRRTCPPGNDRSKIHGWLTILLYLSHATCIWGERERAPSCGLNGRAVMHDRYIRPAPATAHARRYAQT